MSVLVHLYYGEAIYHLKAKETTTIKELLIEAKIPENTVLFTGSLSEKHKTPIIDTNKTLIHYNLWFLEKTYIADLTVYNKTDKYNKELYERYLEFSKEII
jgi:HEPN domain-containing protein